MTDKLDLEELKRLAERATNIRIDPFVPNASLIVAMRLSLPALIAEVERLRAENRTLRNFGVAALDAKALITATGKKHD